MDGDVTRAVGLAVVFGVRAGLGDSRPQRAEQGEETLGSGFVSKLFRASGLTVSIDLEPFLPMPAPILQRVKYWRTKLADRSPTIAYFRFRRKDIFRLVARKEQSIGQVSCWLS